MLKRTVRFLPAALVLILGCLTMLSSAGAVAPVTGPPPWMLWEESLATNNLIDGQSSIIYPAEGEEYHWVAVRLTPEHYPFLVQTIAYNLVGVDSITDAGEKQCKAGMLHRVELYVGSYLEPDPDPFPVDDWTVLPQMGTTWTFRTVVLDTNETVLLEAGEYLFVAVRMAANEDYSMCIRIDEEDTTPDANYWSNSQDPPYPWAVLDDFGIVGDVEIAALGLVPPWS